MSVMNKSVVPKCALASLPWYDLEELRPATDRLWLALGRQFRQAGMSRVPGHLNREVAYERQWTSPDFLFGQACGYDVRMAYADHLQAVATPCYEVPGCAGSNYRSFVVVRSSSRYESIEQLRGKRCVINTPTSHSGMNVLRALVAPLHCEGRFFRSVSRSGAHQRSLQMIRRGQVDVAAIDCITWALLEACRPGELEGTRIIHQTGLVPAPPYVTARNTPPRVVAIMRQAMRAVFELQETAAARQTLRIGGLEFLPDDAYGPIESLQSLADDHNYHEIPGSPCVPRY